MTVDAALLDEWTQGINRPADGQQGYVAVVDDENPPNLKYMSPEAFFSAYVAPYLEGP